MSADRFVRVDGRRIRHRESGAGDGILFMHGFPQTGHCWRRVADLLSSRFRMLVPDVPGFGESDPPAVHDAPSVARMMCGYLDALDVSEAIVVGHDWGGAFALRMALAHAEHVRGLVVVNSPFREVSPLHSWYVGLFNLPVLPEVVFRVAGDKIIAAVLHAAAAKEYRSVFEGEPAKVYQEAYSDPERVGSALAYYRTVTRRAFVRQVNTRLRGRFVRTDAVQGEPQRTVEVPTLLAWGMKDPALPPGLLEGIKRDIPHAEIVELPRCGHFVPEECPEELAGAIEGFADRLQAGPGD